MKVRWMPEALKTLDDIFLYLINQEAYNAARLTVSDLLKEADKLANHPFMGFREPLLRNEPEDYRSLIVRRIYKIIYHSDSEYIYIIAVWDVRQNPSRLISTITKR